MALSLVTSAASGESAASRVHAFPEGAASGGGHAHDRGPAGHEGSEGITLAPAKEVDAQSGPGCPLGAMVRRYDVAAIAVEISLNRYLDYDPAGRMYVLESDIPRVRDEEGRNAEARVSGEPAVSLGLQGDAIQPLTLRVRPGECLTLRLRNALEADEPVSLHIHGASQRLASGAPAVATNPESMALPGDVVETTWWVPPDAPEGTHLFHSHGAPRAQSGHGLFGAVIVEPPGSSWIDPLTGEPATGWAADIVAEGGGSFREFVLYYHELGDENTRFLDRTGEYVPLVDPITSAYRPGARGINFRSEPFMNRLALHKARGGQADESIAYSSYAFGDPATPIMRAYLGDPVKQRLVHAGAEVFHVHHVHGGSIRWRRQAGAEPLGPTGLAKHPPLIPDVSERIDSQSFGPSETFDVANECGAGGCQQGAGDYLVHCHVAHHYFAGMWGLWRVYNTLQDGAASTDSLPPLRELPDRAGAVRPGVTSDLLLGSVIPGAGGEPLDGFALEALVESQLPPQGVPQGYDASVMNWSFEGNRYVNEPENPDKWPGYAPHAPGVRPPLLFDPKSGKLAYPALRPRLGARPPFAPGHSPAPFLDPTSELEPVQPGASGDAGLCPAGTKLVPLEIHAVNVPVPLNARAGLLDPEGALFVLKEKVDAIRASPEEREPLTVRANAGEHCVDIVLKSELADGPASGGFNKVSAHIHFVQFDVQGSDGVNAGFNYEQTVRPFTIEGTRLTAPAPAGATTVAVADARRFQPGAIVGVGMDASAELELRRVVAIEDGAVVLDEPLMASHVVGEAVSAEFVRYRWYPDVQFGTAYFHDHASSLHSWRHGLFGALVAEPPGATYHHPHTGEPALTGALADVHTTGRVSADVTGSFRELVVYLMDDVPITHVGRSTGGALNLRAEPLAERDPDPALAFSSAGLGDPLTPILEAFAGDPVVLRTLVSSANESHTLHVDGHWGRFEPFNQASPPVSTVHLGISERVDFVLPAAGGPRRRTGDYLYHNGRTSKLEEGSWGLIRVHADGQGEGLRPLPDRPRADAALSVCPESAPLRAFTVHAAEVPLPMLSGNPGLVYVLESDLEVTLAGGRSPEPLVLRASVGDCVTLTLMNRTDVPVSIHADRLAYDPGTSGGMAIGREPVQAVAPGGLRQYVYYADPEWGETVALLRDGADPIVNPGLGLYGAIVVGPPGARYVDPETGEDAGSAAKWRVDVETHRGTYRDFTLFMQDEDDTIGTHRMPYTTKVTGPVAINYLAAPLEDLNRGGQNGGSFQMIAEPGTPRLDAVAGDAVRIHVLAPWSEQAQVFAIEGHAWPLEPGTPGTAQVSALQIGALEAFTIRLDSAGGPEALAGDYLYGNHREPYREAGQWGVFRVHASDAEAPIRALADGCDTPGDCLGEASSLGGGVAAFLAIGGLASGGAVLWRRRRFLPRGGPGAPLREGHSQGEEAGVSR